MSRSWPSGSTWQWRKLRAYVLERDGWTCQLRLDGCKSRATDAHHTQDRATVGDDPAYLIAACHPCNCKIGDPTKHETADPTVHFNPEEWTE